ncbi:hypothetical protein NDU88_006553, partial [Pleurodeles waltl]
LSLALFNIYVLPLIKLIEQEGLTIFSYADDNQINFSLSSSQDHSPSSLHSCLAQVATWMNNNSLKLNGNKTEVMILGRNPSLWGPQHWPFMLGETPSPVTKVKNLGFLIDNTLSTKPQVAKVVG